MPNTPITNNQASRIVKLMLLVLGVVILMILYVFFQAYFNRVDVVAQNRRGCERSKLDRRDNAAFQRGQKRYIKRVTQAASVQEDVKVAARDAFVTFNRTSGRLTVRSKLDCKKAYPDARLLP